MSLRAQLEPTPAPAAQPLVQTSAQRYKNIQVMKDVPADQMNMSMHLITGQLGVTCEFCHIEPQFEREDKAMKHVARRMMRLTADINTSLSGGGQTVTCYTCHRGQPKPLATPVLPTAKGIPTPVPVSAEPLPAADVIFTKYVEAVGGRRALKAVTSRVLSGTRDMPTGPGGINSAPAAVEVYQKAPNLVMSTYKAEKFTQADGFDGQAAWQQNAAGAVSDMPFPEQARFRRSANLYEPLDLKSEYTRTVVAGVESVEGRRAYLVIGYPDGDAPERLFFDVESGLLVRRATILPTPMGDSPLEVTFSDYRATPAGVRIPFVIKMTPASHRTELPTSSTFRVERVQEGVAIPDAKFVRPEKPAALK
ncbi:MAG: photosynthetic reaction center cytochrome c subunit family protein [Vicinamibacterales bacterium]